MATLVGSISEAAEDVIFGGFTQKRKAGTERMGTGHREFRSSSRLRLFAILSLISSVVER